MNRPKSDRIIAVAATIVFHVAVLLILLSAFLRYVDDSETRRWPPADKSEILAVDDLGEFVKLGDIPEALPASESDAQPAETDAASHSSKAPNLRKDLTDESGEKGGGNKTEKNRSHGRGIGRKGTHTPTRGNP